MSKQQKVYICTKLTPWMINNDGKMHKLYIVYFLWVLEDTMLWPNKVHCLLYMIKRCMSHVERNYWTLLYQLTFLLKKTCLFDQNKDHDNFSRDNNGSKCQ